MPSGMAALVRLVCVSGELGLLSDHAKDLDELVSMREGMVVDQIRGVRRRNGQSCGFVIQIRVQSNRQSCGRWLTHSSWSAGVL